MSLSYRLVIFNSINSAISPLFLWILEYWNIVSLLFSLSWMLRTCWLYFRDLSLIFSLFSLILSLFSVCLQSHQDWFWIFWGVTDSFENSIKVGFYPPSPKWPHHSHIPLHRPTLQISVIPTWKLLSPWGTPGLNEVLSLLSIKEQGREAQKVSVCSCTRMKSTWPGATATALGLLG